MSGQDQSPQSSAISQPSTGPAKSPWRPIRPRAQPLPVDLKVSDRWGRLQANAGRPLAAIDSLPAAMALSNGPRVVTRNLADFDLPGPEVLSPWFVDST